MGLKVSQERRHMTYCQQAMKRPAVAEELGPVSRVIGRVGHRSGLAVDQYPPRRTSILPWQRIANDNPRHDGRSM